MSRIFRDADKQTSEQQRTAVRRRTGTVPEFLRRARSWRRRTSRRWSRAGSSASLRSRRPKSLHRLQPGSSSPAAFSRAGQRRTAQPAFLQNSQGRTIGVSPSRAAAGEICVQLKDFSCRKASGGEAQRRAGPLCGRADRVSTGGAAAAAGRPLCY